ncbi:hypothetical protein BDF19DRAFT_452560 [Syncephalis fuscata]|nr:hypothetical protein BDF19DRAFT_452560 [Syncephalis fuscata]
MARLLYTLLIPLLKHYSRAHIILVYIVLKFNLFKLAFVETYALFIAYFIARLFYKVKLALTLGMLLSIYLYSVLADRCTWLPNDYVVHLSVPMFRLISLITEKWYTTLLA